jgi:hypothetical protein
MRIIYEIDSNKVWTGNSRSITEKEGRPVNWICTQTTPPNGIVQWNNGWIVLDKYPLPVLLSNAEVVHNIRSKRNKLLADSDWIVIKSLETNTDYTDWKVYRQALRDITSQATFPNVVWPTKPE